MKKIFLLIFGTIALAACSYTYNNFGGGRCADCGVQTPVVAAPAPYVAPVAAPARKVTARRAAQPTRAAGPIPAPKKRAVKTVAPKPAVVANDYVIAQPTPILISDVITTPAPQFVAPTQYVAPAASCNGCGTRPVTIIVQ
ncbi:MAG: hypothetical protein FWC51_04755 [Proteobacteria bacterium]|nr:hypothetical protein [Pseudomonadota bacterium]